jgi:hypothetical protein
MFTDITKILEEISASIFSIKENGIQQVYARCPSTQCHNSVSITYIPEISILKNFRSFLGVLYPSIFD